MNNSEREEWIMNDEGLYNWFRSSRERANVRKFIKNNRDDIDQVIKALLRGASFGR